MEKPRTYTNLKRRKCNFPAKGDPLGYQIHMLIAIRAGHNIDKQMGVTAIQICQCYLHSKLSYMIKILFLLAETLSC